MPTFYTPLVLSPAFVLRSYTTNFPSGLVALHLFIYCVFDAHLVSSRPATQFSANSALTAQRLSGRRMWWLHLVSFQCVVLGFDAVPSLCPPAAIDVRPWADSPPRPAPVIVTVRDGAGAPHGLEGCWKAASQKKNCKILVVFPCSLWMWYLGNCFGVMEVNWRSEFAGDEGWQNRRWKRNPASGQVECVSV